MAAAVGVHQRIAEARVLHQDQDHILQADHLEGHQAGQDLVDLDHQVAEVEDKLKKNIISLKF